MNWKKSVRVSTVYHNLVATPANNRNHDSRFVDMISLNSFNGFARNRIGHLIAHKTVAWLLER